MTEAEERALRRERIRKIVDGLRIIDDDLMTNFFDGSNECMELVLRIVMDMPELTVMEVRTQKELNNLHGRSVHMDVLATDAEGRIINVEIQRTDKGAGSCGPGITAVSWMPPCWTRGRISANCRRPT